MKAKTRISIKGLKGRAILTMLPFEKAQEAIIKSLEPLLISCLVQETKYVIITSTNEEGAVFSKFITVSGKDQNEVMDIISEALLEL